MKTEITTKTVSELNAYLAELETKISDATVAFNDLLNADDAPQKAIGEARLAVSELVDDYNEAHKWLVYKTCYEKEKPMLSACQYGELTKKALVEKVDPETKRLSASVVQRKARNAIDLVDFEKSYPGKGTLARNGQWPCYAESLLKAMSKEVAKNLEVDPETQKKLASAYKDAKAEGSFANLAAKNPSKTNMVKDLQSIVDCIVFLPYTDKNGNVQEDLNALKVTTADVAYIQTRIAKAGKTALATRLASHKEMTAILGNVMYHLTTGKPYEVEIRVK